MLAETEAAFDFEARKAAFARMQRLVLDQALTVVLMTIVGLTVNSPKVKGLIVDALLKPKFRLVTIDA